VRETRSLILLLPRHRFCLSHNCPILRILQDPINQAFAVRFPFLSAVLGPWGCPIHSRSNFQFTFHWGCCCHRLPLRNFNLQTTSCYWLLMLWWVLGWGVLRLVFFSIIIWVQGCWVLLSEGCSLGVGRSVPFRSRSRCWWWLWLTLK